MKNDDNDSARIIAELTEKNHQLHLMLEQCHSLMLETKTRLELNRRHLERSTKLFEDNRIVLNNQQDKSN